jgi:hypothetical protein
MVETFVETIVRNTNTNPLYLRVSPRPFRIVGYDGIGDGNGLKVDRSMGGLAGKSMVRSMIAVAYRPLVDAKVC